MTIGASNATFSPGCAWRLATTPAIGAMTSASRSAFSAILTCASMLLTFPFATSRPDCELSNAVCEMNFSFSSLRLDARVFSASAICARALSSAPWRSSSLASRSAVSIRPRSWPARTDSPSRTSIWRTSPETLALTVAWLTGVSVPDTGSQRAIGVCAT